MHPQNLGRQRAARSGSHCWAGGGLACPRAAMCHCNDSQLGWGDEVVKEAARSRSLMGTPAQCFRRLQAGWRQTALGDECGERVWRSAVRSWRGRCAAPRRGVRAARMSGSWEDVDGCWRRKRGITMADRVSRAWRAQLVDGERRSASGLWVAASSLAVRWQRTAQATSPLRTPARTEAAIFEKRALARRRPVRKLDGLRLRRQASRRKFVSHARPSASRRAPLRRQPQALTAAGASAVRDCPVSNRALAARMVPAAR